MIVTAMCQDWSSFVITARMKNRKNIAIAKNAKMHIIKRSQHRSIRQRIWVYSAVICPVIL